MSRTSSPTNSKPAAAVALPPPRRAKHSNATYKVLLIGDSGVGKSNLLMRFTDNRFDLHTRSTIGVEFVTREIDVSGSNACFSHSADGEPAREGSLVNMQIWDTAGQERCSMISSAFYRNARGIVVVYDTTNKASLLNVPRWVAHAKQYCEENAVFIVVGNKSDLVNLRAVSEEDAEEISHILGIRHYYASALTGDGVPTPFFQLILAVHSVAQVEAAEAALAVKSHSSSAVTSAQSSRQGSPHPKQPESGATASALPSKSPTSDYRHQYDDVAPAPTIRLTHSFRKNQRASSSSKPCCGK